MASTTDRHVGGRYELVRRIARGGGGTVWAGYDHLLERDVAVKHVRIPDDLPAAERELVRARVRSEARAAARLRHPSAVTIYDVVADDGDVHLVLELVEDPTLDDLVARNGPLPPAEAAAIGRRLLDVLMAAHERGIVHRDVKPANIFVSDEGEVTLTDFGIAALEGETRLTRTGATMGSPQFIAPEQAQGHDAAPPADLWGLGASLYFAVEGVPPFERNNAVATVHAVVHDAARPVERAGELAPIIAQLLEKEPAARPSEAWLRDELTRVAGAATPPAQDQHQAPALAPAPAPAPTPTQDRDPDPDPDPGDALSASVPVPPSVTTSAERDGEPGRSPASGDRRWWPAAAVLAAIALVGAVQLVRGGLDPGGDAGDEPEVASPAEDATEDTGQDPTGQDPTGETTTDDGGDGQASEPGGQSPTGESPDDPDSGDGGQEPGGADGSADDGDDAPTSAADLTTGDAVPEAEVPEDWQLVDGPAYDVAVPSDWQVEPQQGRLIDHRDPDSSTYLRVDWTPNPKDDPYADWEQQSAALAEQFENYEERQLTEVTFRGQPAALLEYTYTAGGAQLRAYNLNIRFSDDRAYALNLQGRADDWDEVASMFPAIVGGFEPDG